MKVQSILQYKFQAPIRASRMRHECCADKTSAARVKIFYFDNDTSANIFLHHCIGYMANEILQREEQFHSKNCFLEMHCSHAQMRLKCAKSASQKLNFVIAKVISKSYTLECSCKCPRMQFPIVTHSYAKLRIVAHSNADPFLIKTILCETNNNFVWRNY